jgi:cysteine desulfurase family protein (TIGR01976 family)
MLLLDVGESMLDFPSLRGQFPALRPASSGRAPIFFDGPGGTQVPERVIGAMTDYLRSCNANHGGAFATSRASDRILRGAHEALADFLNAPEPEEVVFGANMTTLTLHLSRAVARTLRPGDEIVVTSLDHDANVTPWILAARDAGATARICGIHPEDCTLNLDELRGLLNSRTRLVALPCASNAVGTINDVRTLTRWAHEVGARVFLDAVHYAPHAPIDVQDWDCDFLVCSVYKFFGPHVGVLWARRSILEELTPYKLRPVPESLPDRWMTGTQNHEGIAGAAAAIEYLAEIGRQCSEGLTPPTHVGGSPVYSPLAPVLRGEGLGVRGLNPRRLLLLRAMSAIKSYEMGLSKRLLDGLARRPRVKVWGITDPARLSERVPTISITLPGRSAGELADHLAARDIYAWSGNMYALGLTERLGLESAGGLLRLGLAHYNTAEEVDTVLEVLDRFASSSPDT